MPPPSPQRAPGGATPASSAVRPLLRRRQRANLNLELWPQLDEEGVRSGPLAVLRQWRESNKCEIPRLPSSLADYDPLTPVSCAWRGQPVIPLGQAINQHCHASRREIRRNPNVVARTVGESTVLVHLQTNRIYELNATASSIWELVDSGESESEVVRLLSANFAVSDEVAERDFKALLAELEREDIVETTR